MSLNDYQLINFCHKLNIPCTLNFMSCEAQSKFRMTSKTMKTKMRFRQRFKKKNIANYVTGQPFFFQHAQILLKYFLFYLISLINNMRLYLHIGALRFTRKRQHTMLPLLGSKSNSFFITKGKHVYMHTSTPCVAVCKLFFCEKC